MPCTTARAGRCGAGGAIVMGLLALHVGLVSVQMPPPARCAQAADAGVRPGPAGAGHAGGQMLRLRGGKKEVKGKKIRQPRKLRQIAAVGAHARARQHPPCSPAHVCIHAPPRGPACALVCA